MLNYKKIKISAQRMKMWAGLASILLCLLIHPSQELPQGSQILPVIVASLKHH
jgi:hypothetical protein